MTTKQNSNLHLLLAAWRDHQENKERGAAVAELMDSRDRLDTARRETQSDLTLAS